MAQNYKRAFQCHKCPGTNDESGCPMWWEFTSHNHNTGADEVQKMCGFSALPFFLTEVVKASNRPAAAVESMRNEMQQGLSRIGQAAEGIQRINERRESIEQDDG